MKIGKTLANFPTIEHDIYSSGDSLKLLEQSTIIGDYEDAFDKPGSSALWFGKDHHLNREEVAMVVHILEHWLETGDFPEEIGS